MQCIFRKENADKALKYRLYRHLPAYEKIIRNLVSFLNTKLFIIYGMSIGKSDSWWWEHIFYSLKENGSELIIYNYTLDIKEDKEQVKQRFINNSIGEDSNISTSELNKIKEHIYVVNFNDQNDTKLFNMEMPTV